MTLTYEKLQLLLQSVTELAVSASNNSIILQDNG